MANTDPLEWRLLDTDFTTVLGILPSDGGNLYVELNEPGSGELKIPANSAIASVVTAGMFAQCNYRGAARGGFLVDNLKVTNADGQEGAGQWLSLSGRGALAILDEAIIWDDGTGNTKRDFSGTKASILITLIDEAVARGAIANVDYDFSASVDSEAASWTDNENLSLTVGTSLLELVRQFADSGIDFNMLVNSDGTFTLQAFSTEKGSNLSETVYFRVGTNCEEVSEDKQGTKIKNVLQMKYRDGFAQVTDPTSITAYRRREEILNIEAAQSAASATTYGAARLESLKDPKRSLPIKVYDGVTPYAFVTYNIGDYITIDRFGVEASERIRGMQLAFNEAGYAIVTITLNDTIYENEIEMGRDLDWLMKEWNTAHDADLLEVRYWAALGDPNEDYSQRGSLIANDKLYVLDASVLRWYDIISGTWSAFDIGASNTPRCITAVGTDIYIGGLVTVWKFDTLTETLTIISGFGSGSVFGIATIGTSVFFSGTFDTLGTVLVPNGVIKYDTVGATWTDIGGGAGISPTYLKTDDTYLYIPVANEVLQWDGASWTQLGTFPEDADNVLSVAAYGTSVLFGTSTGNVYEWDGAAWTLFVTVTGTAFSIGVYLTDVYVSGTFTVEGTHIAVYRGGAWWALEAGLDAAANIHLYESNDNVDIYVCGGFTLAGGKEANEIAVYYNNFEALTDYLEKAGGGSFNLGEAIHNATAKTPMVAADEMPLWDSITQRLRKITWANILLSIKTYTDGLYVALTGNQTIAGVKTFSSDPLIPDEAYDATAWDGVLEPPTKNAVRDKIESMSAGGGLVWSIVTADATMASDNGYIANKGTLLSMALPTTSAVGKPIRIAGMNAGLWKITQAVGQQIHFGDVSTTAGTGGYLASTLTRDAVELVCVVADTEWNVISSVGNITVV